VIGKVILTGVLALTATTASAQSRSLDDVLDHRCAEYAACFSTPTTVYTDNHLPPEQRRPVRAADQTACDAADKAVGRAIGRASWYVTQHEQSRGGVLTFQESSIIRSKLFDETYLVRQVLRRAVTTGNVQQCNDLRDRAVGIVSAIMVDNPVGLKG